MAQRSLNDSDMVIDLRGDTSRFNEDEYLASVLEHAGAGTAYRETLLEVLIRGSEIDGVDDDSSVGSNRATRECRNFSFEIGDANEHIVPNAANVVRSSLAVGRFLWMMGGNDRLEDIRFYEDTRSEKGVAGFSDDGLVVPGSNYGARLFKPRPGLDQVEACVALVKSDPNTRRAAMSVFQPEDAGRNSSDIPCTFGVLLSPRSGSLNMTVVMRSNNAWFLLPYNIFEFSLLGAVMASEAGVDLGSYHHFAVSMHLYDSDVDKARSATGAGQLALEPFGEMPDHSLQIVRELCAWEAYLRHCHRGLGKKEVNDELRRLRSFPEYWRPFGQVVLSKATLNASRYGTGAQKKSRSALAHEVAEGIKGPLGQLLRQELGIEQVPTSEYTGVGAPSADALNELRTVLEDNDGATADPEAYKFHLMVARQIVHEARNKQ